MDRLGDIAAFVAIAEEGSLSAAGRRLSLGASAVSKRLAALEARLGARLVDRTTRRLALTEAGRIFLDHCRQILAQAEAAETAVGAAQTTPTGLLRISAPLSFGMTRLAPLLPAFLEPHPGLRIDLDLTDRYVDLLEEGFDVALRIGALPDSSLVARRIGPIALHLVAAPAYLAAAGRPETPDDLARHALLSYSLQRGGDVIVIGGRRVAMTRPRVRANNGETLLAAARAGFGVVMLPDFLVAGDLAAGSLVEVLPAARPAPTALQAVMPPGRQTPLKTRAFLDFVTRRLAPEAGPRH